MNVPMSENITSSIVVATDADEQLAPQMIAELVVGSHTTKIEEKKIGSK